MYAEIVQGNEQSEYRAVVRSEPSSSMRLTPTLALVLALVLAGCTQDQTLAPDLPPTSQRSPTSPSPTQDGLYHAMFANVAGFDKTDYFNGTLRLEQANTAPGAPVGAQPFEKSLVQFDVSDLIPKGVPIMLEARLQATMSQGDLQMWFSVPDGQNRHGGGSFERGGNKIALRGLVRSTDSPILLNLFYREAEPVPELPYTLSVRSAFDPTTARSAFPIGVTLPTGSSTMKVELVGEEYPWIQGRNAWNLMLWGPDDSFLGHHELAAPSTAIPLASSDGGEYVLMLQQGGRMLRILTPDAPAALRALPQQFVFTEAQGTMSATSGEWTTTHEREPVLAGITFTGANIAAGIRASLVTPKGPLFEFAAPAGPETLFFNVNAADTGVSSIFEFDAGYATDNLVAGEYRASVAFDHGYGPDGVRAFNVAAFWQREAT